MPNCRYINCIKKMQNFYAEVKKYATMFQKTTLDKELLC
jgi:hypothetical protein